MDELESASRMLASRRTTVWLVLLIGVLIGGCNVFDVSTPEPNTVEDLLADARAALAAGKNARAVTLLERAHEKDSTDIRVRIELGNALYSERGLDVLALRAAAEHMVDDSDSARASGQTRSAGSDEVCTRGATPDTGADRYRRVRMDAEALRRLADRASVVERVRRLVVKGVFGRRPARFDSASVQVRRKGFLVGAATVITSQVIAVREVLGAPERTLYFDRAGEPPRAFVACAESESALARNHEALCALSDAARRGVEWLRARNRLSGRDEASVLVDRLQTVAQASDARTGCSKEAVSVSSFRGRAGGSIWTASFRPPRDH